MHGPRKYCRGSGGGGGGVQAHPPQVLFSHQLHLRFFLKKTIIFQDSREGPTFSGGGGGGGGGGGVKLNPGRGGGGQSIRIQIACDFPGVRTPKY